MAMSRPTRRRSSRLNSDTSPATTTTNSTANPSPAFSTVSSAGNETPPTSDDELPLPTKTGPKRQAAKANSEKKATHGLASNRGAKAPAKQVYVELETTRRGKSNAPTPIPALKSKGTGKAPASASLEYDEDAEMQEESDVSGSEFVGSDDDEDGDVIDEDEPMPFRSTRRRVEELESEQYEEADDDDDDYDVMLHAATLESLQGPNVAGSSSRVTSANPDAVKRARVAEARLAAAKRGVSDAVDDSQMMDNSDLSSAADSDADAAPNGKGKKPAAVWATPKKSMTLKEMREFRRKERLRKRLEKRENHVEEQALRKKLGRKLTYAEKSTIALHKHHPELRDVWGDLAASIPIVVPTKADPPANLKLTLLPFQRESLFWMKKQETGIWHGGMLADEMGMGKTIQMIALMVSEPDSSTVKANLVVAPTVAIMQWKNEIAAHTDGLRVLIWHGSGRESNPDELKKYDVVLTTYAVLESSFRKQEVGFKRKGHLVKEKSPLHKVHWNRIILDEAHNIKERATNTAKATFELVANARWCLSGTPLQNRVGELYSLVRFLGGDPFSFYFCKKCDCKSLHWKFSDKKSCDDCGHSPMQHTCFWNNEILTPIQKNGMVGPGAKAFKKLKILLDRMMLRRTKLQRADDLGLPPRTVLVRRDYFSPEEKELYLSLFSDAKRQFNTYLDEGTILNNYSNIFSLLTRMRQMACHPDLVLRSKTNATKFIPDDSDEAIVCRLCNDIAEDAIQSTRCRHIFDRQCISMYLDAAVGNQQPNCPVCHVPLTIDLDAPALELEQNLPSARQGILGRLNLDKWRSSSKIEALVEELSNLRMQDATSKSLVFSQFVNFLDLIAYRLQRAGFKICRLEGTMSPQARDATIKHFMENVEVTVFLVSLKAGGVALNLTEASRVYLMDSWWNPAVEYQAMDRIHRLGQRRPVKAIKLVIEDSIESRIVQLQEKKSAMVDATLSADDSAMGRLTPADLGFLFRL
ncbi:SNF2 family N-terminal domain-containing protein [Mycena sanguinolenta]|nr:SNF2 family N-terminal domain-containing protein [Mycena sanguinolenta]